MSGIFISFEGPDGAGKTTALNALVPLLKEHTNKEIVESREPGGSEIAEQIRKIILAVHDEKMDDRTEALLYAAARRQHVIDVIRPTLAANKVLLSDRFVDSSIAYQGGGREIGTKEVAEINDFAIDGTIPDLTVYFDISPEIGLSRIRKDHEGAMDRLEQEALSFHQRVHDSYLDLLAANPDRIKSINADQKPEKVVSDALDVIIKRFPNVFNGGK
ncbi:dTMP kinase [Companilactobacillus nodensis]|uniref:Thymidylate kinase n=1 Tax=Companilactobacillus nodensis DSM 19682 = JCM 14932 = NBRC 107160 TaxID=1423775 RepID=A0A0R1K8J3_9LACO|nr:dTMP kinase [Companilactobacillus nodensis]KRK79808.1 thymidylate kinase [Companilactobacillus nodensis DSM 19682 = JCM 14932 = NBRC 107160]